MPRPGWHLRAVMRDRATGNSHGDAQRRIAERKVREQAHREAVDRFGVFTAENAAEAIAWQDQRIRELTDAIP
jgi:hypothetical protein